MPTYHNNIINQTHQEEDLSLLAQIYVDGTISFEQFNEALDKVFAGEECVYLNYFGWGTETELK